MLCLGRHTVTGLLCTGGRQFQDWSQDFRLFSEQRVDVGKLFAVGRRFLEGQLKEQEPLVVAMDDTTLRKTGRKVPGAKYLRDPLGPPFRPNFIWGQRWIQLSGIYAPSTNGPSRGIPVDFQHAPLPKKPRKKASQQEHEAYKQAQKEQNLSKRGADVIQKLRQKMNDDEPGRNRPLWMVVDGSYTNQTVLRNVPEHTVLIGRIRKDAAFYAPWDPATSVGRGRKRRYGEKTPTPEELRQDTSIPWRQAEAYAAGKTHTIEFKEMGPVLSRVVGADRPVRFIAVKPLSYRLKKGAKLLYRQPAYLICTDPDQPVEKILQAYFRRWEIEVNFRDEKQLFGIHEAQVRSKQSVETLPPFVAATYGLLLTAGAQTYGATGVPTSVPPPAWQKNGKTRAATKDLVKELRWRVWADAMGGENISGFATKPDPDTKPEKFGKHLESAVFYA